MYVDDVATGADSLVHRIVVQAKFVPQILAVDSPALQLETKNLMGCTHVSSHVKDENMG